METFRPKYSIEFTDEAIYAILMKALLPQHMIVATIELG